MNAESGGMDAWHLFREPTGDDKECDYNRRPKYQHNNYILGVCIAVAAVVCDCGSAVCTQALGRTIPKFELNMWRFVLQSLLVTPIILSKRLTLRFDKKYIPDVFIICLMYNIYNGCFYTATTYLPLGTIAGTNNAFILIIVAVVTVLLYKECTFYTAWSVVICVTGMILITQPGFMFNGIYSDRNISHFYHPVCHDSMNQTVPRRSTVPNEGMGYVLLAVSASSASIMYFKTNKIKADVGAFVICFWVGISGTVVSPLLMFIFEDFVFPTATVCQLLLLAHALFTVLASVGYINALHFISPLLFSLLRSFQITLLCVSQYTFMNNINSGKQNAAEITGVLTVFVGIVITPTYELCLQYCSFKCK